MHEGNLLFQPPVDDNSEERSQGEGILGNILTILQFHFCASFTLLQAGSILSDLLSAPQILLSFTLAYKNPGLSTFKCLTRNLSSFTVNLKFSFFNLNLSHFKKSKLSIMACKALSVLVCLSDAISCFSSVK